LGHELGYTKLELIHTEWIHHIWTAKRNESLQAFRGSYKTTSILIVGVIWYLLFNPNARILIAREEGKNARKTLNTIRQQYRKPILHKIYKEMYGIDFKLIKDTDTSITLPLKTSSTPEGNIEVAGLDWSVTGSHYDRIHCDDIITINDRWSNAKRERTKRFVYELSNIIEPDGITTYSGTPWHRDDAWTILPKPKKYSIYDLRLPDITPEVINERKRIITPSLFACNYELKHIADEESLFPDPQWGEWKITGTARAHLDAKYKGKHTMALTMLYKDGEKIHAYGKLWTQNIEDKYDDIVNILKLNKIGTLYLEENADKGLSATQFRNRGIPVTSYHEKMNKHVKITGYLYKFFKDILWAPQTDNEYMNQIVDYQEGQEPDDAPDSAASCLREMGFAGVDVIAEDFSVQVNPQDMYDDRY